MTKRVESIGVQIIFAVRGYAKNHKLKNKHFKSLFCLLTIDDGIVDLRTKNDVTMLSTDIIIQT